MSNLKETQVRIHVRDINDDEFFIFPSEAPTVLYHIFRSANEAEYLKILTEESDEISVAISAANFINNIADLNNMNIVLGIVEDDFEGFNHITENCLFGVKIIQGGYKFSIDTPKYHFYFTSNNSFLFDQVRQLYNWPEWESEQIRSTVKHGMTRHTMFITPMGAPLRYIEALPKT